MSRFWLTGALIWWISALAIVIGRSATLETTVKYLSPGIVYLNAGSASGIVKGDSAVVWRDDQIIAHLEVVYVAQNSSSAKIIESSRELRIGDRVQLAVSAPAAQDSLPTPVTPVMGNSAILPPTGLPTPRSATRIHGRVALQILHQDDLEPTNHDVTKPSLALRTTVENLGVNYLNLSINLRARQVIQRVSDSPNLQSDWDNRIYEFALQYDNPTSALNCQFGRISSGQMNGIGLFDGAVVEYKLQNGWSSGIFGGTRPDLATSSPSARQTTAGLYTAYERGSWTGRQVRGTLALAGRYYNGVIDEEFIYEQLYYSWTRRFYVMQSAEISLNRGWRQQVEGSTLSLANVLVNANYLLSSSLSFDFTYDNRQEVHTYETMDTPDSLFDDALRQGFQAGLSTKLPLGLRTWLRGGLRTRASGAADTRTVIAGVSRNNLLNLGLTTSLQFNRFESSLSSGYQVSLSLAWYLYRMLSLQLDGGNSRYQFDATESVINYHWLHLGASSYFSRHLYASSYGEIYRGDSMNTNRFGVELGYRF